MTLCRIVNIIQNYTVYINIVMQFRDYTERKKEIDPTQNYSRFQLYVLVVLTQKW